MWTTFPVILVFLAAALQSRAENDNFTQDILLEEYGRQTTLVARNPPRKFTDFVDKFRFFRPSPQPLSPPHEVQAEPPRDVIVVPLERRGDYRLASIKIGSPAQQVRVVVHTDSSCFWATYNPDQSTPDERKPEARRRTCDSRLHDRPTVSGDVYPEQISVGEMKENGMVLSVKKASTIYDGEMGLALPTITRRENEMMFVPDFIKKWFPEPIFALHLDPKGGELHIGRPIPSSYDYIEYHKVTQALPFLPMQRWQIGPAVIGINGDEMVLSEKKFTMVSKKTEVVSQKIETVFDSTLGFIRGPPKQVERIYKVIRGHEEPMRKGYEHTYPCEKQVKVHFRWGNGRRWILNPRRFKLRELSAVICEGIIRGEPRVVGGPWVVGHPFIETLYLVFHWTPEYAQVGLGRLPLPPPYKDVPPMPPRYEESEGGAMEKGEKGA